MFFHFLKTVFNFVIFMFYMLFFSYDTYLIVKMSEQGLSY
jgi:hypothetical protein